MSADGGDLAVGVLAGLVTLLAGVIALLYEARCRLLAVAERLAERRSDPPGSSCSCDDDDPPSSPPRPSIGFRAD